MQQELRKAHPSAFKRFKKFIEYCDMPSCKGFQIYLKEHLVSEYNHVLAHKNYNLIASTRCNNMIH